MSLLDVSLKSALATLSLSTYCFFNLATICSGVVEFSRLDGYESSISGSVYGYSLISDKRAVADISRLSLMPCVDKVASTVSLPGKMLFGSRSFLVWITSTRCHIFCNYSADSLGFSHRG